MLKFRISSKTYSYHVDCKDKIDGLDNNFRDNITYISFVNETAKMVHYNCNKRLIIYVSVWQHASVNSEPDQN